LQQEVVASAEEEQFARHLLASEAVSVASVAARIDALIVTEACGETEGSLPLSALRKIRRELIQLAERQLPGRD